MSYIKLKKANNAFDLIPADDIVYVTGTAPGNTTRTQGTVSSVPDATSVVVGFTPAYTSASSTGYQIDLYDPKTFYIITA